MVPDVIHQTPHECLFPSDNCENFMDGTTFSQQVLSVHCVQLNEVKYYEYNDYSGF